MTTIIKMIISVITMVFKIAWRIVKHLCKPMWESIKDLCKGSWELYKERKAKKAACTGGSAEIESLSGEGASETKDNVEDESPDSKV